MTGKFNIDGIDAFGTYGVFVAKDGFKGLVQYAPLKKFETNDWPEEDGVETDLYQPVLDSREFNIEFAAVNGMDISGFLDKLFDGAYHTFQFLDIGRSFVLRLSSQPNLKNCKKFETFSLQFALDMPVDENYEYVGPGTTYLWVTSGYELDGLDLYDYGIRVLQGTKDEILKTPAVKRNLLQSWDGKNGAVYDGENVYLKSKDVKLYLLMAAGNMTEFWKNYDAFIHDLVQPGERQLYIETAERTYPCCYKSCDVQEFTFNSAKVWFKFSITLIFTSFRRENNMFDVDTDYLLSSEAGALVITDDTNEDYIDTEGN
jgi:hypothetical protein